MEATERRRRMGRRTRWRAILLGAAFSALLFGVQNSSEFFADFIRYNVSFLRTSQYSWAASLDGLPTGTYFISVGRPRGQCALSIDRSVVSTTGSLTPDLRGTLLLGSDVKVSAGLVRMSEIACDPQPGFAPALSHTPVVTNLRVGVLLQGWRAFTEILLGPLASLLLFAYVLFVRQTASLREPIADQRSYFLLAIAALAYSTSLAHYPRLFVGSYLATALHIALRIIFGLALFLLFTGSPRVKLWGTVLHLAALFGATTLAALKSTALTTFYFNHCLLILTLCSAFAVASLFAVTDHSSTIDLRRALGFSWVIAQCIDQLGTLSGNGVYVAPTAIALVSFSSLTIFRADVRRQQQIERASGEILRTIASGMSPSEKLAEVSRCIRSATHFERCSAYADGYLVGIASTPGQVYVRVSEGGYRKPTERDTFIYSADDRGLEMSRAVTAGEPRIARSMFNEAWYINLPIGTLGCINLSDSDEVDGSKAYSSISVVKALSPALRPLAPIFANHATRSGVALEAVRASRGTGVFDVEFGSIILDISRYTELRARYGDPFGLFIASVYFPALVKRVRPWAVRESTHGDELFLLCLPELMTEDCSVSEAMFKTVEQVLLFIQTEGRDLCETHGYEPIVFTLGASAGRGRLISEADFVRTEGEPTILAARLQKAAPPGAAFVSAELAESWPKHGSLSWTDEFRDVSKKTLLRVRRVQLMVNPRLRNAS